VDLLRLRPGDRVLEIGCGPGLAVALAAAKATKGKIIGIDHSPIMIRQAEMRNRQAIEDGRVELIVGGIDRLERRIDPFDKIFSVNVVQFLASRAAFFTQAFDMLKPAGALATTYKPRSKGATRADAMRVADECVTHMTAAGFESIRIEELPLEPVPAISVVGLRSGVCNI
jgi:cyclopropane fatty-acyl-phospholipid synthase-like methyltransferase